MIGKTLMFSSLPFQKEGLVLRDFQLSDADSRGLDTLQISNHSWELTTLALNSRA